MGERHMMVQQRLHGGCLLLLSGLLPALFAPCARADEKPKLPKLLIDSHMHVWSGDPARFPFAHPYEPKFMPPKIPATVEILIEEMDRYGVSHCVLVQTNSHGWDNRYLVECVKKHPKRFRGQDLIDPTDANVADKLEYWMKKHGLAR